MTHLGLLLFNFMKYILILITIVLSLSNSYADDIYDSSSGVLSIPVVNIGGSDGAFYANVQVTVQSVASVNSANRVPTGYDTYTPNTNVLAIPSVNVNGTIYSNVYVTVGSVLSVESVCASAAACGINIAKNSTSTSTSNGTLSCTTSNSSTTLSTDSVYYAPTSYDNNISTCIQPYPLGSPASSITNRNYYLLSDSISPSTSSNYLQIGGTYTANSGYPVTSGSIGSVYTQYNYLNKLLQAVSDSSGYFRLDSQLHPNNSIDYDSTNSNTLVFRNNFGLTTKFYGYVTFSYDNTTKLLQAKQRYLYNLVPTTTSDGPSTKTSYAGTWSLDPSFGAKDYYVSLTSGGYKLVAASSGATKFYLFNSPINLGIPNFLNPLNITYDVAATPAPFGYKATTHSIEGNTVNGIQTACPSGSICSQVNSKYQNQLTFAGSNASTKANADSYLATIQKTVEATGEKLRYPIAIYSAFRDQALATKLLSDSVADGTPGQNLVPYVYYTNEQDATGKYHPFMVIVSYGNQPSPNGLRDIQNPPGAPTCPTNDCRTKFSNLDNIVVGIPLKDYGLVTDVTQNTNITSNLWTDRMSNMPPGVSTTTMQNLVANVYTFADKADNGLLIDGQQLFPTYNNTLVPSNTRGELSLTGCHVGQGGGGPHCHIDAYQTGYGMGIYNDADYLSKKHPPLIGFTYDGLALFGIYRSSTDSDMLGYGTALDNFGGHNHNDANGVSMGYHLHAHTVSNFVPELMPTTTLPSLHILAKGAYVGKTTAIPNFRSNIGFTANTYLGASTKPSSP